MDFNKLKDEISHSLSGLELSNKLKKKCDIISYPDIIKFKNIDELLGKNRQCVLLYLTSKNYGHWCCVYENPKSGNICFFDSYGFIPDDQLKFVSNEMNVELRQHHKYLTKLLYDSKKPIEYNEYQLQDKLPGIATCGRWVITRLNNKNISVKQFAKYFLNNKIQPDILVTLLTL